MTLSFWEPPVRDFDGFDRVVNNLFGTDASARAIVHPRRPVADLAADKDGYLFRFDLPGVSKDAIEISVENEVLTVSGDRKPALVAGEGSTVYRRETPTGKFARSFRLPEDADAERVTAAYTDGVLEIRVARAAEVQPRRIPISVS